MRFSIPDALAVATLAITCMRAGIETQAGEATELGYPWWTFLVAAMVYALVGGWALLNDVRWLLLVGSLLPASFALIHMHDLRTGNLTVWATLVIGVASAVAQGVAIARP